MTNEQLQQQIIELKRQVEALKRQLPYRYEGQTVIFERPCHFIDRIVVPFRPRGGDDNGVIGEVLYDRQVDRFYGKGSNKWDVF